MWTVLTLSESNFKDFITFILKVPAWQRFDSTQYYSIDLISDISAVHS